MIINKSLFLITISAFIFFNCSDEPTSIGDIPPRNTIGLVTINSSDDSLSQTSSYFHPEDIRLSSAGRILIGRVSSEINASILIKYQISLPDSVKEDILNDSLTVTSAVMEFSQVYSFGEGNAFFDFTVHKALENWSIDITEDSIVQVETADSKIAPIEVSDSITTVALNNQLLQEWLEITADTSLSGNYGVHLIPTENTQKVLGYQALTSAFTNFPFIKVVVEKTGGAYIDTLFFTTTADLTLMKGSVPAISPENILVQSGYIVNTKLSFDLSNVPENIIVNKAELILTVDTLETKVGSSYTNAVQAYFLFDSTNTDSVSSSSVRLSRFSTTFRGEITGFVRAWLGSVNNQGILLSASDPFNGVERFAIKGSDTSVSAKPLLRITYTKLN